MRELGRFAPTPSGRMHMGNMYSALLAWLSARSMGGEMLLRIEDLDTLRCPRENGDVLKEDLKALGLFWDYEQPNQSTRSDYYDSVFKILREKGEVYPCWCTRGDLKNVPNAPHASDGHPIYPRTCRRLSPEERRDKSNLRAPLWRLAVPEEEITFTDGHYGEYTENLQKECGDFILCRADGVYSYQLAVTADDIAAGVTQVVRGVDLLSSTPRQMYIYRLLDAPLPRYYHLPLLTAPDGRRLSKRDEDLDMGQLLARFKPQEILGKLAHAAGLIDRPESVTFEELVPLFSWEKVPKDDVAIEI